MAINDILTGAINDSIVKEQQAQEFYQKAADMVDNAAIKDFFLELKRDEVGHEKMLKRVLEDLKSGRTVLGGVQEVKEDDLKDLGISRFLKTKDLKATTNYQEAMVVAMKREEEAWRGYSKMSKMSDNEELRDLFLLLAQVEAGHLRRIEAVYEKDVLEGY